MARSGSDDIGDTKRIHDDDALATTSTVTVTADRRTRARGS